MLKKCHSKFIGGSYDGRPHECGGFAAALFAALSILTLLLF